MAKNSFHLKSMTAYGRGAATFAYGRFTIEIQSVNRRYLEVSVSLPRLFMRYEIDIRKKVAAFVGRGMVNVSLTWKSDARQPISVVPNLSLAKAVKRAWESLALELGLEESISLSLIAQEKELLLYEDELIEEEVYQKTLNAALEEALGALLLMKQQEGETLLHDLLDRLAVLQEKIVHIEELSVEGPEKYRQKLSSRIEELFSGNPENEERILREIAIYSERVDITEEIVRFKSHLEQCGHLLEKPLERATETRGKTLDFLLQELHREINTIGSKASDLTIASHVVTIKSELEKIREQVQNIE